MKEYQEIRDTSPLGLKMLNDQLRLLWFKTKNTTTKDVRDGSITLEKVTDEIASSESVSFAMAQIVSLEASKATIGELEAIMARVGTLEVDSATIADLSVQIARIDQLDATSITVEELDAVNAIIDTLQASKANITDLDAVSATIVSLQANKADITSLAAETARINTLYGNFASIDSILSQSIFSELAEFGEIRAGSAIIADEAIGSAQISNLDVAKLNAGDISTAKFRVIGSDGRFQIQDNLLQVFDGTTNLFERIALGDVNNDGSIYGLRIRGADGETVLFDENGQTKEGFSDGYNKLDDNSLNPSKIDIEQVITRINDDSSETIKSSRILVGVDTLDVKFTEITNKVEDNTEDIITQGTQISSVQGQITNKVWQTDVTAAVDDIQLQFEDFDSIKANITETENLWVNMNHAETSIIQLKDSIGLLASQTDIDTLNNTISHLETSIESNTSSINLKANAEDVNYLTGVVTEHESQLSVLSDRISLEISSLDSTLGSVTEDIDLVKMYFDFTGEHLSIGKSSSPFNITLSDNRMSFLESDNETAYLTGQKFYVTQMEALQSLKVGVHQIEKYNNDITFVRWVG